jgi:hypothetical protein
MALKEVLPRKHFSDDISYSERSKAREILLSFFSNFPLQHAFKEIHDDQNVMEQNRLQHIHVTVIY